ncbi:ABC transporter permease [Clostridium estertheticum]|uniref:ABC transporter permease n=1 Tax=Clostridium estertheticum TaxID=238834 RepID=A0AA47EKT4_9CLOT|nr:ABC transporter permease [Clostridium estertheticum]MBU3155377.1 ABC transporter permease [Clostridium estertheticum]MBU3197682.1 ABC transporter permease [Clostridium estertheticum]WAG60438.1 ABC transporter permease [Clostridium estertheticum]WAG65486.1 ABC transporter permease [Clostridium estertheticum]
MKFIQAYRMAIKSIVSNKVRSFLTMLGVIIGVGSVIIAVGVAQGSSASITNSLSGLGSNLVNISIMGRGSNRNVTYEELAKFQKENSTIISNIAPQASGTGIVKSENLSRSTTILGTSPEYSSINSTTVQEGRFLIQLDIDYNQKIAVIGTAVANDVFKGQSPIGRIMKIMGQQFKVVGVLTQTADGADSSTDDRVIIPISVATKLNKSAVIKSFSAQATSAATVDQSVTILTTFLTKIYKNSNAFRVSNMAAILSSLNSITTTLTIVLAGVAGISLVVGGVGIMNIMLVSVTERTREIGIRKAIGAKKGNILTQFILEALILTGMGGITGILIGVCTIHFVIGGLGIVPEVYSMPWIIFSFGFSLAIGLIFGTYPANKAANLNPIDALAFE